MDMKIVDKDVQGVLVEASDGDWCLRLQAPTILEDSADSQRNYLWYRMKVWGWEVLKGGDEELEAAYIAAIGRPLQ